MKEKRSKDQALGGPSFRNGQGAEEQGRSLTILEPELGVEVGGLRAKGKSCVVEVSGVFLLVA